MGVMPEVAPSPFLHGLVLVVIEHLAIAIHCLMLI